MVEQSKIMFRYLKCVLLRWLARNLQTSRLRNTIKLRLNACLKKAPFK